MVHNPPKKTSPAVHKTAQKGLMLPALVFSPADVSRLVKELDRIDETLVQLKLRNSGQSVKLPKTSQIMDLTVEHNKLNLLKTEDRHTLKRFLMLVEQKAPRLHFSFGVNPSAVFLERLVSWLRLEMHSHVLITIGLQPGLGAGCILRSTNKFFDFSLRQTFLDRKQLLLDKLVIPQAGVKQ